MSSSGLTRSLSRLHTRELRPGARGSTATGPVGRNRCKYQQVCQQHRQTSATGQIATILSLCPPARRWCCPGWRGPAPAPAWPRAPSGGSPRLCTGCRCSPAPGTWLQLATSAVNDPSVSQSVFTIKEKAPTRAFSWLKAPTCTFTFKTHKSLKGWEGWLA